MTTAFDDTGQHPVTSAIAAVTELLHDIADLGLWILPAAETETNLTALAALRHQITELELRHARHADRLDLGANHGATDTGSHWANTTRQTKRDAKRRLDLAHALDHDHEAVRTAMAPAPLLRPHPEVPDEDHPERTRHLQPDMMGDQRVRTCPDPGRPTR